MPVQWKMARITVVPKTENPTSPNDTRPIAIQPVITKIFDKCILKGLTQYAENSCLIPNEQFGFRKGYGTIHALVALNDFIYEALDDNHVTILVSLDIQKAFDTVDREILSKVLSWHGINDEVIHNLLNERYQFVEVKNGNKFSRSRCKMTTRGIMQGSATSLFYFLLFSVELSMSKLILNFLCMLMTIMLLYQDPVKILMK